MKLEEIVDCTIFHPYESLVHASGDFEGDKCKVVVQEYRTDFFCWYLKYLLHLLAYKEFIFKIDFNVKQIQTASNYTG